jgi:hypothetical protein
VPTCASITQEDPARRRARRELAVRLVARLDLERDDVHQAAAAALLALDLRDPAREAVGRADAERAQQLPVVLPGAHGLVGLRQAPLEHVGDAHPHARERHVEEIGRVRDAVGELLALHQVREQEALPRLDRVGAAGEAAPHHLLHLLERDGDGRP